MGKRVYAVESFPDDDLLWRIEWIGGVGYNTSAPSDPLIEVCLAQLPAGETNPLSARARSSQVKRTVKVTVGLLPYIAIASVWQKRRSVVTDLAACRHRLRIDTSSCRTVTLDELASSANAIPRRDYLFGSSWPDVRRTLLVAVEQDGDPYALMVPTAEIIRFYYAPSTRLAQALFWGEYDETFSVEQSGIFEEGVVRVHLFLGSISEVAAATGFRTKASLAGVFRKSLEAAARNFDAHAERRRPAGWPESSRNGYRFAALMSHNNDPRFGLDLSRLAAIAMLAHYATILLVALSLSGAQIRGATVVGISGSQFTLNGQLTYSTATGFPQADPNLAGTLLNVRAVQGIFDDANYPQMGSRKNPYHSNTLGDIFWDYPDGPWDAERNVREFLAALPDWRRCGLLAFTVNLQGGGPPDGNYGEKIYLQPHNNSGFDPHGNLKPAYADRLRRVIAEADRQGMVVIVGFFYFGSNERIEISPDDGHVKEAILQGCRFLKQLPHRNVLIEINNETNARSYKHHILQPDGALDAVLLAQQTVEHQIPVSMSWSGGIMPRGSRGDAALRSVDYVMFHTNGQTPEEVHQTIASMRKWTGYERPLIINEDSVSTFNLQAAAEEHVGWGFYDNGLGNYRDGYQNPPVNWKISSPVKWLFFEQVARLTGSSTPPRPEYHADDTPQIEIFGLKPDQVLKQPAWIEALVKDRHPRWPIKRVEFFIDGKPYSYRTQAPYMLNNQEWWDMVDVSAGKHVLRVVAYDRRGPRFTELCSMVEIPFVIEK